MAIGERKQGKTLSGRANRVQPEIQLPVARVAISHLVDELALLEELYAQEVQIPDPKEEPDKEAKNDAQSVLYRRVAERNRAISSQLDHIKKLSQAASGCIHPPGHNTVEEKEAAAEFVAQVKKRVTGKLKGYEESQAALTEAADSADPDGAPDP